jgi:hypothetical protein
LHGHVTVAVLALASFSLASPLAAAPAPFPWTSFRSGDGRTACTVHITRPWYASSLVCWRGSTKIVLPARGLASSGLLPHRKAQSLPARALPRERFVSWGHSPRGGPIFRCYDDDTVLLCDQGRTGEDFHGFGLNHGGSGFPRLI